MAILLQISEYQQELLAEVSKAGVILLGDDLQRRRGNIESDNPEENALKEAIKLVQAIIDIPVNERKNPGKLHDFLHLRLKAVK